VLWSHLLKMRKAESRVGVRNGYRQVPHLKRSLGERC
jgi:hypothetical protein